METVSRTNRIEVDFNTVKGPMKIMHAVNNGPLKQKTDQTRDNYLSYKALKIPYARTHDSIYGYGSYHKVDVTQVFPDFDADENDPKNYDFILTDEYLLRIQSVGTKVFYRLGQTIEHDIKKYGTLPPKDFHKWARICEHIIRHYNYGWADGFNMGIEYWEIWNEPDQSPDDATHKPTWGGTKQEFFDLYKITATHLKKCFPELKIGGPALTIPRLSAHNGWLADFLAMCRDENVPLDFFSWHRYFQCVFEAKEFVMEMRQALDDYGFKDTESICDEWNYVKGWSEWFPYSVETISNMKGAAFVAGTMLYCQDLPVDMLMYYDARICVFNGLWDYYTLKPRWSYYAFEYFTKLYELKNQTTVKVEKTESDDLYAVSATDGKTKRVMIASYDNEYPQWLKERELTINLGKDVHYIRVYFTTENNMKEERQYFIDKGEFHITVPIQAILLIEVEG